MVAGLLVRFQQDRSSTRWYARSSAPEKNRPEDVVAGEGQEISQNLSHAERRGSIDAAASHLHDARLHHRVDA